MLLGLILFFVVLAAIGIGHQVMRRRAAQRQTQPFQPEHYALRLSLFSPAERSFYSTLLELELPDITVLAKVRLTEIFEVQRKLGARTRLAAFNAIAKKHVDFLLVRSGDCRPVIGIKIEAGTKLRPDQVEGERRVRAMFAASGLPLLRVAAKPLYSPAAVRRWVYEAAPMNFPLSGFALNLNAALQPDYRRPSVSRAFADVVGQ